jgi:hypothetical protein
MTDQSNSCQLGTKKGLAASEQSSGWKVKRAELGNSEIHHSGSSWTDHAQKWLPHPWQIWSKWQEGWGFPNL